MISVLFMIMVKRRKDCFKTILIPVPTGYKYNIHTRAQNVLWRNVIKIKTILIKIICTYSYIDMAYIVKPIYYYNDTCFKREHALSD